MTFTPFQNLIPRAARKYGIFGAMRAIGVCKAAEKALAEIFEKRKHKEVMPKSFSKGVLKIKVPNSSWAQEITINRIKIIDKTNLLTGRSAVKSIRATTKNY